MKTFVVRVWTPTEPIDDTQTLRGLVERIGSGSSVPFAGEGELLAFLRQDGPVEGAGRFSGAEPVEGQWS